MRRDILLIGGGRDGVMVSVDTQALSLDVPKWDGGHDRYMLTQFPGGITVGLHDGMTPSEGLNRVLKAYSESRAIDSGVSIRGRKVFIEKCDSKAEDDYNGGLIRQLIQQQGIPS